VEADYNTSATALRVSQSVVEGEKKESGVLGYNWVTPVTGGYTVPPYWTCLKSEAVKMVMRPERLGTKNDLLAKASSNSPGRFEGLI
jgi:hypothetical protein